MPQAPQRKRTTIWRLSFGPMWRCWRAPASPRLGADGFFIHLESRQVDIGGITVHPGELWMKQIARKATMDNSSALRKCKYLLHDRDTKVTIIPCHPCFRWGRTAGAACARSEPECLPGTLGKVGQIGVPVEGDPVRRAVLAANHPREGQRPAVSSGTGSAARGARALPRAFGRALATVIVQRRDGLAAGAIV